ncbi:hypothetical protein COLO4_35461 [Corchorus olitorius]|uniref:Endonuclease/exonuclease/phosphatase n=1 Tax=Corchorus olitorius TaxID=93759 RepID=A0A1R3GGQ7_9ROSI|nr:hypothetical protein COLO4_35461 [Corchorus olitorius]
MAGHQLNGHNNEHLPDINDLLPITRRLIRTLQGLLRVGYPYAVLQNSNEIRRRPVMREVTILIFALYKYNHRDQPYDVDVVRRWLGLTEDVIPSEVQPDRPQVINVGIENTITEITLHSNEKTPISVMGNNIFQAHFSLTVNPHMFTGNIRYDLIVTTGQEVVPCPLLYDRDSWGRMIQPPSLSVLAYNASGVAASPVRDYISSITNWYRPHLLFITDTRLPSTEAQEFANLLHYNLVTTMDSIRDAGGVWILSRPNSIIVQLTAETETQIKFNMQAMMAR